VQFLQGRFEEAEASLQECLALHNDLGMRLYRLYWGFGLGRIHLHAGKVTAARAVAEQMLSEARELGDTRGSRLGSALLGEAALAEAAFSQAQAYLQGSGGSMQPDPTGGGESGQLAMLGLAANGLGRDEEADQWSPIRSGLSR
jgi:hypothetical protein